MAKKADTTKGVYGVSMEERDKQLANNLGKYPLYEEELTPGIGEMATISDEVKNKPTSMGKGGLLGHTISNKDEYGKKLNEFYDRDVAKLEVYGSGAVPNKVSPIYSSSYDYSEYMADLNHLSWDKDFINKLSAWDESLADIAGALNVTIGDGSQSIFQSLFDNRTYGSMALTLEPTRVGVVRDFSVRNAVNGSVITNINNWGMGRDTKVGEAISKVSKAIFKGDYQEGNGLDGTDTALGVYSSALVGKALEYASQFNTIRNTKYITPELQKVYGLNTYTVHNFSYLLRVDDATGEANSIEDGTYIVELNEDKNTILAEALEGKKEADTSDRRKQDYIRYQNVFENAENLYASEGNKEFLAGVIKHKVYNPSEVYMKGDWGRGYSIEASENSLDKSLRTDNNEYFYREPDGTHLVNELSNISQYDISINTYQPEGEGNTLLEKTSALYKANKIGSLVARFHTSFDSDKAATQFQSAVSKYGMSRGRNLLTKDARTGTTGENVNGYDNPYCRVWTDHHQYSSYKDAIRPFLNGNGEGLTSGELQNEWKAKMRTATASKRLSDNSVLNKNGLVNIAPTKENANGVDIKRCMFSIENLAWKDVNKRAYMNDIDRILSPEQIGPNGGRIMWFPPYDLTFSENVNAKWDSVDFIGRGEPIFTYNYTQRSGQLDFTILADHPSIVDSWAKGAAKGSDDDEQTLLRFFAGCETIDPRPDTQNKLDEGEGIVNVGILADTILDMAQRKSFAFNVYFPNDFSGRNITGNSRGETVINYLLFGENDNLNVGSDVSKYRGYEMLSGDTLETPFGYKGQGLTTGVTSTTTVPQTSCGYAQDNKVEGKHADMGSAMLNKEMDNITASTYGGLNEEDVDYTLTDVFLALDAGTQEQRRYLEERISEAGKERVKKLKELLGNKDLKIDKIVCTGFASNRNQNSTGATNNDALVRNRAESIGQWLNSVPIIKKKLDGVGIDIELGGVQGQTETSRQIWESAYGEKRNRRTEVRVYYYTDVISEILGEDMQLLNNSNHKSASELNNNVTNLIQTLGSIAEQEKYISDARDFSQSTLDKITDAVRKITNTAVRYENYRYDYEREYFTNIQVNDPLTYSKIVDKIKYFSPAFHSITPEGLNARLTFLHQCTRQGHTIGATSESSGWGHSAGNLAFGRPPVCVLRIGDFFNTKIIIESVNITYGDGGIQWDMNPEGIGIQPMMCKVSLGIKFLGGSDLEAPVARLQNAVSFNYYANTSLYDNRSDVMRYSPAKEDSEYAQEPWIPTPKIYK